MKSICNNCNKIFSNVWSFCFLALVSLCAVSTQQSCVTPSMANGYCVPLMKCSWYANNSREPTKAFVENVRKSECFVENGQGTHMCCNVLDVSQSTSTTNTTSPAALNFKSLANYASSLNPRGVNILNETKCGFIDDKRIAFGDNTKLFEYPFMALLRYEARPKPIMLCGGSLITDKFVLTAAHCIEIKFELIGVRLGEWDLTENPDTQSTVTKKVIQAPPVEDFDIVEKIVHPDYIEYSKINDIALVKLASSVTFKRHIQPICLPITQQSIDEPQTEFFIAGWGTTEKGTDVNILQKAKVVYQPVQVCLNTFKLDSINENNICAGGTSNIDSCSGDSGGPLFFPAQYRLTKRYVQFGIVSFGIKCNEKNVNPGVYTNVVRFMPWITSVIN